MAPVKFNTPIRLRRHFRKSGDIVVMDRDGVIVVPWQDAEEILAGAKKIQAKDAANVHAALTGDADRQWVEDALKEQGTEIIDDQY